MMRVMRNPDYMALLLERWVQCTHEWWLESVVLKIINQVLVSCVHKDNIPAIEAERMLLLELSRNILMTGMLKIDGVEPIDLAGVLEFLFFLFKIADASTSQLEFRRELRHLLLTKCHHCHRLMNSSMFGRRCGRCRVTSYCSTRCQKMNYPSHRHICMDWTAWIEE